MYTSFAFSSCTHVADAQAVGRLVVLDLGQQGADGTGVVGLGRQDLWGRTCTWGMNGRGRHVMKRNGARTCMLLRMKCSCSARRRPRLLECRSVPTLQTGAEDERPKRDDRTHLGSRGEDVLVGQQSGSTLQRGSRTDRHGMREGQGLGRVGARWPSEGQLLLSRSVRSRR